MINRALAPAFLEEAKRRLIILVVIGVMILWIA